MRKYKIEFVGRTVGAIGITYKIVEIVESNSEENAILKLYDRYEHIQRPYVTDVEGTPGSQL